MGWGTGRCRSTVASLGVGITRDSAGCRLPRTIPLLGRHLAADLIQRDRRADWYFLTARPGRPDRPPPVFGARFLRRPRLFGPENADCPLASHWHMRCSTPRWARAG